MYLSDEAYEIVSAEALASRDCGPLRSAVRRIANSPEAVRGAYDAVALETARRFVEGRLPFEDADWIANQLYAAMMEDGADLGFERYSFAPLAFEIFEAFDGGEFSRAGEKGDPVERYTRPALRAILERNPGR